MNTCMLCDHEIEWNAVLCEGCEMDYQASTAAMWGVPQPTTLAELGRDEAITLLITLFGGSMQDLVDRLAKRGVVLARKV